MNKFFGAAAFALALGFAVPAMAASSPIARPGGTKPTSARVAFWKARRATVYLDAITKSGKKYDMKAVDKLSATEFMAACKDDTFMTV